MFGRHFCGLGLVAGMFLLMGGCMGMQSLYYDDAPQFERRPRQYHIDVYVADDAPVGLRRILHERQSLSDVPLDAIPLGRVDAQSPTNWARAIDGLVAKARVWGGDAIVIDSAHLESGGTGSLLYPHSNQLSAEIIRYKSQDEGDDDS